MRSIAKSTIFVGLFVTLGVIGFVGAAVADGDKGRLSAQLEIEDLMSCYAYSFDAIARAVDATN